MEMSYVLISLLFILLFAGVPVYIALGLPSLVCLLFFSNTDLMMISQRMIGGIDKFALLSVPFFIMGANVMKNGGIGTRIVNWARVMVGAAPGGLAATTEVASMFFGAVSGSSPSTVVAIGGLLFPELAKSKYSKGFSVGLITSSGSVALLIPPSITAIIYATLTNASIGELFIAGLGAGIVYGLCFLVYIFIYAKRHNIAPDPKTTARQKLRATLDAGWALGVPVIIIGGIYTGICTPTEASGLSTIYALVVSCFIYREMSWKSFKETLFASVKTTSQVMILMCAASVFAWVLTVGQMPQQFSEWVSTMNLSPLAFLGIICVYMLIAGCFIDGVSAFMIILPMVLPMASSLNINLVHLGIIMITTVAIGMFTPPFGLNLFVAQPIAGGKMSEIFRGVMPFVLVSIVALILIVLFPEISLVLPNLVYAK